MIPTATRIRLQHQHEVISWLISGFTKDQLNTKLIPGKWSIFENLVHMAVYQHTFQARVELIVSTSAPEFDRYVAENDPQFSLALKLDLPEIVKDLFETRHILVYRIFDLSDEQLSRKGIHPKFGKMDVTGWTEFFLLHEAHHLYTIFSLVAQLKSM